MKTLIIFLLALPLIVLAQQSKMQPSAYVVDVVKVKDSSREGYELKVACTNLVKLDPRTIYPDFAAYGLQISFSEKDSKTIIFSSIREGINEIFLKKENLTTQELTAEKLKIQVIEMYWKDMENHFILDWRFLTSK